MSAPLILASIWAVCATVIGLLPGRFHWRGAITLMATAVPLLIWIAVAHGPWWTLGVLLAMMSILRWPVLFLARRIGRILGGRT